MKKHRSIRVLVLAVIGVAFATLAGCPLNAVLEAVQEKVQSYEESSKIVATPAFSPSAGTYSSDQSVTISDSTDGATIYYTTDGSTPTASSTKYTGAITVAGEGTSVTIKAIAAKSGMTSSTAASATYVIHYGVVTPSGLSFSAVTAGGLTASWGSTGAKSYQLYRSTSAGGPYTQVYSGSAASFTESASLMPDTTYYYRIQGTYTAGTSPQSSEASATTLNCLFVLNQLSQTIQTFRMNTDGTLTSSSSLSVSNTPSSCVVSPNRSFLYASVYPNVCVYSIGSGGALTQVGSSAAGSPKGIAITADGTRLYSADWWNSVIYAYSVNTSTGALTQIGSYSTGASTYPAEVAITPNGAYLYATLSNTGVNKVAAFKIESSGALTALSPSTYTTGANPTPMVVSPNGSFLYVENAGGGSFTPFTINSSTGALTSQSTTAMGAYTDEMAITSNGAYLYAASEFENKVYAYSINSSTGVLTLINTYDLPAAGHDSGTYVCATALNRDSTRLYVTNNYTNTIASFSIGSGGTLTTIGYSATGSKPVYLAVH